MKIRDFISSYKDNKWFYPAIFVVIALLFEIFICNYRSFESKKFEELDVTDSLSFGTEIVAMAPDAITVKGTSENARIEIKDINTKVNNIFIDIADPESLNYVDKTPVTVSFTIFDEANALGLKTPDRIFCSTVDRSKYIKLQTSGECSAINIIIKNANGKTYGINKIIVNAHIPFQFRFIRFLLIIALLCFFYYLRPSSALYDKPLNLKSNKQLDVLTVLVVIQCTIFVFLASSNYVFTNNKFSHHHQYQDLTDALIEGQFHLLEEPPQCLIDMENPYDSSLRAKVLADNQKSILWDHAYYNGHYYVYFGVGPVLTFYLPWKLITGSDFETHWGIVICGILFIVGALLLITELTRKLFKTTPFVVHLMNCLLFINGCGSIFLIKRADFYNLPILLGLTHSVWGLYFWFSAKKHDGTLSPVKLLIGSYLMAYVSMCRPQMLMGSFLAIPIFYKEVFKDRKLFSTSSIKQTICFVLPYIVVAGALMYYNYARFGSPFDFGANYNLTTNDMTKRGFVWDRTAFGLFSYLFQPPVLSSKFPYISSVYHYTNYMGTTIYEAMFGGVIFNNIILALNFFTLKLKKELKAKGLFMFCVLSAIFSAVIIIADTQMAGVLARYYSDFSWLLYLPAIIITLTIFEKLSGANSEIKKLLHGAFLFCFVWSMFYNASSALFLGSLGLSEGNPTAFYAIRHFIEFWL